MSAVATELWDQTVEMLRRQIDDETYSAYFEPIRCEGYAEGQLVLAVPNVFFRNWLITSYQEEIEQIVSRLARREVSIRYRVEPNSEELEAFPEQPDGASNGGADHAVLGTEPVISPEAVRRFPFQVNRLNPNNTFTSFVVGESNRFAYTAAQAVSDPSSNVYNPLFLYGGVGLGKTHLLHAVGQGMIGYGRQFKTLYVSSETFMNTFIEGIQKKQDLGHFRNLFRGVDLLMIDDVQFLAGAERTQTEFFHTFNHLYNAGKKIVISSDLPPKELHELEERLRSRFEQGLIVDIQPPDLETRVAILRKKAAERRLVLSPEVEIYIAERIKTNIRKLEGALTKISAHHAVTQDAITPTSVRSLLGPFFTGEEPMKISIEKIQICVCKFFDLELHDLTGHNRSRKYTGPRQVACYLAREMTELSFPDIARKFGGRDHTSIIHSHRKVSEEVEIDLQKRNLVHYLTKIIKENSFGYPGE